MSILDTIAAKLGYTRISKEIPKNQTNDMNQSNPETIIPKIIKHDLNSEVRKIEVFGAMFVTVERGDIPSITISGGEDLDRSRIIADVQSDRLQIKTDDALNTSFFKFGSGFIVSGSITISNHAFSKGVQIKVVLPSVSHVTVNGSGTVCYHEIDEENLEVNVKGSGDLFLSGKVTNFSGYIAGSGDIDGDELFAKHAKVEVTGSGDASINAAESVDAVVVGSGDIVIFGYTKVRTTRIQGSGDIKFC